LVAGKKEMRIKYFLKLKKMLQGMREPSREKEKHKVQALAQELQELMQQIPSNVEQLIEEVIIEESNVMGLEEIETGKQYIKTGRHHTETECVCCAAKIQVLEERLCHSELTVLYLTQQLRYALHHFVKKTSRAMILQNLPNIGM